MYRQRHPERTVFYRLLFHYFDKFLVEYENHFEKEYGYFRPVIKEKLLFSWQIKTEARGACRLL
jgi:hypothetical protein